MKKIDAICVLLTSLAEYAAEFVDFLYHSWTVAKWPDLNPKTNCNNTAMFLYAQTYNLLGTFVFDLDISGCNF